MKLFRSRPEAPRPVKVVPADRVAAGLRALADDIEAEVPYALDMVYGDGEQPARDANHYGAEMPGGAADWAAYPDWEYRQEGLAAHTAAARG